MSLKSYISRKSCTVICACSVNGTLLWCAKGHPCEITFLDWSGSWESPRLWCLLGLLTIPLTIFHQSLAVLFCFSKLLQPKIIDFAAAVLKSGGTIFQRLSATLWFTDGDCESWKFNVWTLSRGYFCHTRRCWGFLKSFYGVLKGPVCVI